MIGTNGNIQAHYDGNKRYEEVTDYNKKEIKPQQLCDCLLFERQDIMLL